MRKLGKKYVEASKKIEKAKLYDVKEAISLVKETSTTKFDSSVEVAMHLNIDTKKSDQQLRGSIVLPNGTGKSKKILVLAKGTAAEAAKKAGADFVKTSTGFATPKGIAGNPLPNGASEHHIKLMRKTVGPEMGVKASGGIRSPRTVITMLEAGANRIGTSSSVHIIENWDESVQIKL